MIPLYMASVVFCVYGTAGDILPCIAVAQAMRRQNHEVKFVTSRWLGLYSRKAGFRTVTVGDSSEKHALFDPSIYTTRFDGLDSWRKVMVRYALPLMQEFYPTFLKTIRELAPDLIVNTAQSYWGGLAATELGIAQSCFHLYPSLFEYADSVSFRTKKVSRFGGALAKRLLSEERRLGLESSPVPVIDWAGIRTNLVFGHDPSVMDVDAGPCLGFPYWDQLFSTIFHEERSIDFLNSSANRRIVVCLGSFMGLSASEFWRAMATVASNNRSRFVLVGLGAKDRNALSSANVLCVPYVALSRVLPVADLFIHHGGIGSTYAGLRLGVPSLIHPRAFDQTHNARLVKRLGVGSTLNNDQSIWGESISQASQDEGMRLRAKELQLGIIPADIAAKATAERLMIGRS